MKRISADTFRSGNWRDNVTAIRIENGEFYWLADVCEWPNAPDFNKEGLRVFVAKNPLPLLRDMVVVFGSLDFQESEDYEGTPMYYDYETEDECNEAETVYNCLLNYVQPYSRNGQTDEDDYDIFVMTSEELAAVSDALRDGDYIIIDDAEV